MAQFGFGIRVFPSKGGSVYDEKNYDIILKKCDNLGVDVITHLITPDMATKVQDFAVKAYNMGMPSWLTCGKPREVLNQDQWNKIAAKLDGKLEGKVELLCGWNEPNHQRNPSDPPLDDWANRAVKHNEGIMKIAKPRDIPVGTPQLWSGDINKQYDDLEKLVNAGLKKGENYDVIVWHLYMRGGVDPAMLDKQENKFRSILNDDDSPIVCTESGFFTADNYSGGSNPVTEEEQAKFLPQLVQEYHERGWGLGIFELLDDPDPDNNDRESNFGIIRVESTDSSTWTHKPAFGKTKEKLASF